MEEKKEVFDLWDRWQYYCGCISGNENSEEYWNHIREFPSIFNGRLTSWDDKKLFVGDICKNRMKLLMGSGKNYRIYHEHHDNIIAFVVVDGKLYSCEVRSEARKKVDEGVERGRRWMKGVDEEVAEEEEVEGLWKLFG